MYSGTPSTIYSWSLCILVYPVLSTPRVQVFSVRPVLSTPRLHVFWYSLYYLIYSLSTCILVHPVLSTLGFHVFW